MNAVLDAIATITLEDADGLCQDYMRDGVFSQNTCFWL
jgi:hypothetical protein